MVVVVCYHHHHHRRYQSANIFCRRRRWRALLSPNTHSHSFSISISLFHLPQINSTSTTTTTTDTPPPNQTWSAWSESSSFHFISSSSSSSIAVSKLPPSGLCLRLSRKRRFVYRRLHYRWLQQCPSSCSLIDKPSHHHLQGAFVSAIFISPPSSSSSACIIRFGFISFFNCDW